MTEYVVRADTTPPADLSGTAFSHLDVRWLVSDVRNGAELTAVGQTVYPAHGGTHEQHSHPNAEETIIVMSGHGSHRVGDTWYDVGPGDVIFVPRKTVHGAVADGDEDFVILWVLGGASSLGAAGYISAEE
ncbi:MAG TPA: cupin domain-containing protein [Acidimicrobiia bacterium]|nr:cupin domain-containing protein [Acidimicrobiia bacterium]